MENGKIKVHVQSFTKGRDQCDVIDWGWHILPCKMAPSPPKYDMCLSLCVTNGTSTVVQAGGDWWYLDSQGAVRLPYEIAEEVAAGPKYIEPTDEDAKNRPLVEVTTCGIKWLEATLFAVMEIEDGKNAFAVTREGKHAETWLRCRMPNPKYKGKKCTS
jgi:hypothetical protein